MMSDNEDDFMDRGIARFEQTTAQNEALAAAHKAEADRIDARIRHELAYHVGREGVAESARADVIEALVGKLSYDAKRDLVHDDAGRDPARAVEKYLERRAYLRQPAASAPEAQVPGDAHRTAVNLSTALTAMLNSPRGTEGEHAAREALRTARETEDARNRAAFAAIMNRGKR